MIYATIKVDKTKATEIKDFFQAEEIKDEKHPYDFFSTNYQGVHIHACKNKKEIYSITFSGEDDKVMILSHYFSTDISVKEVSKQEKQDKIFDCWEDLGPQIGSDEVGKGDFFGPLVVVASYVDKKDIPYLERLKINDSKKMKDDYILDIGEDLKKHIKNYIIMISADKLSKLHDKNFNIDKVLSLSHNLAHKGLKEKYDIPDFVITYVDEFLSLKNYQKYVLDDLIKNPLYFRTKGETYYPSVAVSSVIARYTFLKEWKKMEEIFHTTIPKGASGVVDNVYGKIRNQTSEVDKYVKRFFNNYKKRNSDM